MTVKKFSYIINGLFIFIIAFFFLPLVIGADVGDPKWAYETEGGIVSSPAIGPDNTIYIGSNDGNLYAINTDGSLRWKFPTHGAVHSHPVIGSDGTIYIGSWDQSLYAINPNGTLKWNFLTGGPINSSPALGMDGTIYIGSRDKSLYAIRPDGTLKWIFLAKGELFATPTIGRDGTIYVGSWDHYIYAIKGGSVKMINSGDVPSGEKKEPSRSLTENSMEVEAPATDREKAPEIKTVLSGQEIEAETDAFIPGPGNETEVKEIQAEITPEGEEKVFIHLGHKNIPRYYTYNGERPRLVFDFYYAYHRVGMSRRIQVNGDIVRQIRMAYHRPSETGKPKVRVVLDLALDRDYKTRHFYLEDKNIFVIIVSPSGKIGGD